MPENGAQPALVEFATWDELIGEIEKRSDEFFILARREPRSGKLEVRAAGSFTELITTSLLITDYFKAEMIGEYAE